MKNFKIAFILCLTIFLSCKKQEKKEEVIQSNITTIYTIGDSTMADKPNPNENPERGWCQILPQFLNESVVVENHAVNGRSTRSFINEKKWETVYHKLKKGDYVFIQFGHNDQKENSPKRFTNPHTAYRNNIIKFVKETRKKEAIPVLFSSIVRRKFNEFGTLIDTHGAYPLEARLVAQDFRVPFIDLQYLTEKLEESHGIEGSKKLHLHYLPNETSYYPKGKEDDTHLSILGASEISKLALDELQKNILSFSAFIK